MDHSTARVDPMAEIAIGAAVCLTWILICFALHLIHRCAILLGRCAAALEQINQRATQRRADVARSR